LTIRTLIPSSFERVFVVGHRNVALDSLVLSRFRSERPPPGAQILIVANELVDLRPSNMRGLEVAVVGEVDRGDP
jgi:hypothetical protein